VLESIVGLDFLPRGDGVVTRRPLELRLNHVDESIKPYGVFPDEIPGKKFTNFSEVRDNINGLTDKVCGANKNIVDKPIVLQVFSHTCPDLTLIDLPGITRIAIGDQPKNIEQITRAMCHRYMSDPRTIILCVIPANADITNSDGL
jgi:vacuolar protein sorting-associated protein 1